MNKQRKHYSPEEKVPVSNLCEELKLQPTVFYHWLKEFFENWAVAFRRPFDEERKQDKQRIATLEAKLKSKNEVLSELMEEHVALKKVLGSFKRHLGASGYPGCGIDFVNR
jgi:transposase-like protein